MDAKLQAVVGEQDQKKRLDMYKELVVTALSEQSLPDCRALLDHLLSDEFYSLPVRRKPFLSLCPKRTNEVTPSVLSVGSDQRNAAGGWRE
jgi:hypothetical protein